jgi:hypothetical protein
MYDLNFFITISLSEYLLFFLPAIPHTISFSYSSSAFHKDSYQSQNNLIQFLRHQVSFLCIFPCHNNRVLSCSRSLMVFSKNCYIFIIVIFKMMISKGKKKVGYICVEHILYYPRTLQQSHPSIGGANFIPFPTRRDFRARPVYTSMECASLRILFIRCSVIVPVVSNSHRSATVNV